MEKESDILGQFRLAGRVILLTGAAGGMGRVFAEAFCSVGCHLVLTDINPVGLQDTLEKLVPVTRGGSILGCAANLMEAHGREELIKTALDRFGQIDVLVNCAGVNIVKPAVEVTESDWDFILGVNLKAVFFLTQAVGRVMISQGQGKIVNIASQAGLVGLPGRAAYSASKGGLNILTKTLAAEWGQYNINVNAIAPTFIRTPMTKRLEENEHEVAQAIERIPLGRMGTPGDLVGALLYLSSGLADFVTGHTLVVDGGWLSW